MAYTLSLAPSLQTTHHTLGGVYEPKDNTNVRYLRYLFSFLKGKEKEKSKKKVVILTCRLRGCPYEIREKMYGYSQ
jgi:hypothetical protein